MDYLAGMHTVDREASTQAVTEVRQVAASLRGGTEALQRVVGMARTREQQRASVVGASAIGVVAGILLLYVLPLVLPTSAGDWLASPLIGGGRWQAGQTLMERANPEEFDKVARLYKACGARSVESCEATLAAHSAPGAAENAPALAAPVQPKVRRER